MSLSWKTAITRKALSAPMRYLKGQARLFGRMLDYGAGKGFDADALGMDKYDPKFFPVIVNQMIKGYDVVTSNYVLNVIEDPKERKKVEDFIIWMLRPGGDAYIAVRNDKKNLNGTTSRGTWQGNVKPSKRWSLIKENSKLRIYHFRKQIKFKSCPFCGSTNIRSGYMCAMTMGVECMDCHSCGPNWSYDNVIGEDGILLKEYHHLVAGGGVHDELDPWLQHRAELDWNARE
jgi:hypothetical protein